MDVCAAAALSACSHTATRRYPEKAQHHPQGVRPIFYSPKIWQSLRSRVGYNSHKMFAPMYVRVRSRAKMVALRQARTTATSVGFALFLCLLTGSLARADAPLFSWLDAGGTVHITDRLADVPEPYYSTYKAAQLRKQQEAAARAAQAPGAQAVQQPAEPTANTAPIQPSVVHGADDTRQQRLRWQAQMAYWRTELQQSLQRLQRAEAEHAAMANNLLLRQTPTGKAQLAQFEEALQMAKAQALRARHMLLTQLPAQAQAQHVPQQWLAP